MTNLLKVLKAKSFTQKHSSDECMRFFMEVCGREESIKSEPKKRESSVP